MKKNLLLIIVILPFFICQGCRGRNSTVELLNVSFDEESENIVCPYTLESNGATGGWLTVDENIVCRDTTFEIGTGRIYRFEDKVIDEVYSYMIDTEEFSGIEYFLDSLPSGSQRINAPYERIGLLSINYEIFPDKKIVALEYQGGVTEIAIKEDDSGYVYSEVFYIPD